MSLADQLASVLLQGLTPAQATQLADALRSDKPTSEQKATKLEANYREADSDRSECGNCQHYTEPDGGGNAGSCDIVAGSIDPSYVCDWWEGTGPADRGRGSNGGSGGGPVDYGPSDT